MQDYIARVGWIAEGPQEQQKKLAKMGITNTMGKDEPEMGIYGFFVALN